ncbi:ABC transporter substrate-binding protein [Thermoactinomyces sp. CICC 10521]|uniref:ABC transporter substrate-binding protein n=1 Tax=Thermoactinomyces sp. CICC 10521 TaxID=2767426 RepID=UPI0018DBC01B|nr:ABC transporter substrate-binding protein [Thermoactinomyces sp. CICC 10521]MBH8606811.1 ABC transporter substrate-binding protein [Thermoactinomyces sp. CICC 10521]
MNRLTRSFGFVLALVIVLLLTACSSSSSRSGLRQIRLVEVTHSLFYAPQYVALEKGFFKEQGLDIQLSNGNGGDKTMTTLVAGQSDIVLVGAEAAIYVTARSSAHPITAFAQLTQTDGSFLVSRQPIPHFDWSMLKGKSLLGQRRGGMPEMISEYVQRKHGLTPHKDVQIIQNVNYQNLANAFVAGTGDFVQLFEPMASKIEKEKKGYIVASFGKDSGHVPYTCYMTNQSYIKQNPDIIRRFTRAVQKGQDWVATHTPGEIADVIAPQFPDTDRDILVRVIQRYKEQDSYAKNTIIDEEEYNRLLTVMSQAGELPAKIPYQKLVDTSFAKEVSTKQKQ